VDSCCKQAFSLTEELHCPRCNLEAPALLVIRRFIDNKLFDNKLCPLNFATRVLSVAPPKPICRPAAEEGGRTMKRILALFYGMACYLIFLATFLYAIWFIWKLDAVHAATPWPRSLLINTSLLALFAVQHSVMARQWFKRVWARLVPPPIERSTYVLAASAALLLLFHLWQPLPTRVWKVESVAGRSIVHALFVIGWGIALISTFLIDHFDLLGLKQVWTYWCGRTYLAPAFQTPGLYKWVRHPLYVGFILAFWSTPDMTVGHLYFAVMCTAYILVAIQFEEHDLITFHGDAYRVYRSGVSMLTPWPKKKKLPALDARN